VGPLIGKSGKTGLLAFSLCSTLSPSPFKKGEASPFRGAICPYYRPSYQFARYRSPATGQVGVLSQTLHVRFFSSSPDVAKAYGPQVFEAFVKMNRPYIVDAKGSTYSSISVPDEMRDWVFETMQGVTTDNIAGWAHKHGYLQHLHCFRVARSGAIAEYC